mgnify:CR=1 FL=1
MQSDLEEVREIRKSFEEALARLDRLIARLEEERERIKREFERRLEKLFCTRVDLSLLKEFLEEPYCILPKSKDEYYVIVPKWVNFQIGWLEHRTRSYNIFLINRYMQWITPIPQKLKEKLRFPEPLPLKVYDGYLLTGKAYQEEAWRRYRKYLSRREGEDRIKVKRGLEFQLVAKLIEDGILPFIPRPVDPNDLREVSLPFKLRPYQKEWWKHFLEKGAVGIYAPYATGKSLFGVYCLARVKGRKLVVVPTLTLKEQWLKRMQKLIPEYAHEVEIVTYRAYEKVRGKEWKLTIYDECHHLPANTYVRLATIKTAYRIGLSGSPFREDHREHYIFALTGFPLGVDWTYFVERGIVRKPLCKVYIVSSEKEKFRLLDELLKIPLKTVVFCDLIKLGEKISKRFGIPFVYGATKQRLEILRKAQVAVVSRVGDEGVSLPDIERVIEVAFLGGSRMQESQRFGRLMHALREEPEHIIIMTEKEYEQYHRRLYAIAERGFRIEVVR